MRFVLPVVALVLALTASTAGRAASPLPPALETLFGGPFSMVDQNGAPRGDKDFRGRFMLVYFGYTTCPSICPANLQHMADALERLGDRSMDIVPVFVSIDPARDRPEQLKEYVAHFGETFVGLTGSEAQVREIAKAYRVHRRKVVETGAEAGDYLVDHASITYLMGPDGKFRTLFPHNTTGDVMAERIAGYLER